ncbi:MAG: membrane protein insertion efficiency factor YidD [Holophagaceae bacterium]
MLISLAFLLESFFSPSRQPSAWFFKKIIKFYQINLSSHLSTQCRFHPSCSHYGYGCLERFGTLIGGIYIIGRLARCHPLSKGGNDPIPNKNH